MTRRTPAFISCSSACSTPASISRSVMKTRNGLTSFVGYCLCAVGHDLEVRVGEDCERIQRCGVQGVFQMDRGRVSRRETAELFVLPKGSTAENCLISTVYAAITAKNKSAIIREAHTTYSSSRQQTSSLDADDKIWSVRIRSMVQRETRDDSQLSTSTSRLSSLM